MSDIKNINPDEFTTLAEFDDAIEFVAEETARIEMQVNSAKGAANQYGEYSDSDWYARATAALRMSRAKKQTLARKRADLAKKLRESVQLTRERQFIEVCRRELPKEEYLRIWALVDKRKSA